MSTTSASCCCEDTTRARYGIYIKGSGPKPFSEDPGWNQNSLNLYYNKIVGCKPCEGDKIHGGVSVSLYTGQTYGIQRGPGTPTDIRAYTGDFIIPYNQGGGGPGTAILQHFLDAGGVKIDDAKKKIEVYSGGIGGGGFWYREPGLSVNEMIQNIIDKYENKKVIVNGLPVKICDCFTDELYTSEEKTKDENFKAVALQALCSAWRVGTNAENIIWDTPVFLGTHDTTVGNVGPGQYALKEYLESSRTNIVWPPAQSKFATTLFLPKSWAKDRYTEPMMMNMGALSGRNRPKEFREDPQRPAGWAPWIVDNPHTTDKTDRYKFIRLFLGVLRLAPDGLRGIPFDGTIDSYPSYAIVVTPGLWDFSRTWTDPDMIAWDTLYSEAVSRIMTPSEAEYKDKVIVTKKGFASGILVTGSEGCDHGTACGGRRYGQTDPDYTSTGIFISPEYKGITRPPETDILYERANIEYARGKDTSFEFYTPTRAFSNSLVYYTVNNDTSDKCPVLKPVIDGKYRTTPGGPSQRGCCCVTAHPTDNDSSSPNSGSSSCPSWYSSYQLGFPEITRGKIGNERNPYILFHVVAKGDQSRRVYSFITDIKFYARYQPVSGCGTVRIGNYEHMNTDTVPQAWWCCDGGQTELAKLKYPIEEKEQFRYAFITYPQFYAGTAAKLVSNATNGQPAGAFYNCNIPGDCPPDGGIGLLATQRAEVVCVTGDNPNPDPVKAPGDGAQYICGGFGCEILPGAIETCSDDRSGPFTSSDCLEGSYETRIWTATPITWCAWAQMQGLDPYNNPQEVCCYRAPPPEGACEEFLENPSGTSCVENKIKSPINNPFLAFTSSITNYGSLLTQIGSKFRVKKIVKEKTGYYLDPYKGISILDFTSSEYKQTLVTSAYGKKLEFGTLRLKRWAPVLENTYGPYNVPYISPIQSTGRIYREKFGLDADRRITPRNKEDGNLEHINPEWPQAVPPPPITKTKAPSFSSSEEYEKEQIKIFQSYLEFRRNLYPPQRGNRDAYYYSTLAEPGQIFATNQELDKWRSAIRTMKDYWDARIRYELADIFAINYDKGITGPYYPNGIPDLKYTNKKILVKKDTSIEITQVPEYELNWFHVPFERVVTFE